MSPKHQKRNPRSSPLPFAFRMSIPRTFGGAPTHRQYSWITCECNAMPWMFRTREDRGRARAGKRGNAEKRTSSQEHIVGGQRPSVDMFLHALLVQGFSWLVLHSIEINGTTQAIPTAVGSSLFGLTAPSPCRPLLTISCRHRTRHPSLGDMMVCGGGTI